MRYLAAITIVTLLTPTSGYLHFRDYIPNGHQVPNPCPVEGLWNGVGHRSNEGGGRNNPFGTDWAKNDLKWDKCLCEHDSDGDGKTNGEELGDPECKWKSGDDMPASETELSHPGICEPLDSETCREKNFWLDCDSMIPFECPAFKEPETQSISMRFEETEVPPKETYVCTAFTFPPEIANGEFHMIGAKAIIDNQEIMHHLIVYGCPDTATADVMELYGNMSQCSNMATVLCEEIIFVWSLGSDPDCFDPEFGVRLGRMGFKTIVIGFLWNNPLELEGEMDSSGVEFYYTAQLREFDAVTLIIGSLYLELPPGQDKVEQVSRCPSECTNYMFEEPVFISQIFPHMHALGRTMLVQLIRDGRVIQTLINEHNYDYNDPRAKKFRPPVKVMPGDEIFVNCTFDTSSSDEFTFFGEATSDEMCLAFIQYYPKRANATYCWGYESKESNIGTCGFTYGEAALSPCYAEYGDFVNRDESYEQLYDEMSGFFESLKEKCDLTGRTCMDGCQEVIAEIKEHSCFDDSVDGWTKAVLLPFEPNRSQKSEDTPHVDAKLFIQAFASCNERHDNDARDDNKVDDERDDHDHDNDVDGCVFDPPEPGSANTVAVSVYTVMCTLSFSIVF